MKLEEIEPSRLLNIKDLNLDTEAKLVEFLLEDIVLFKDHDVSNVFVMEMLIRNKLIKIIPKNGISEWECLHNFKFVTNSDRVRQYNAGYKGGLDPYILNHLQELGLA